jgi:hypothetical protein
MNAFSMAATKCICSGGYTHVTTSNKGPWGAAKPIRAGDAEADDGECTVPLSLGRSAVTVKTKESDSEGKYG